MLSLNLLGFRIFQQNLFAKLYLKFKIKYEKVISSIVF